MFRRFFGYRTFARAAAFGAVALIVTTTGVLAADDAVVDPDGATPFTEDSSSPSFDLGDLCQNDSAGHDVLVKAKNGSGSTWANSAVLTLTANGVATGTNAAQVSVGVGSPSTISLPATWNTLAPDVLSADTAVAHYTVTTDAVLGAHDANADWTLTGSKNGGGTLGENTHQVHVSWNVIDCNPNSPPAVEAGPSSYTGSEGSAIALNAASATDADGTVASVAWTIDSSSVGSGSCSLANATSLSAASITCTDNGTAIVKLTASDNDGASAFDTANVLVNNAAPTATFDVPSSSVDEGSAFNLDISDATDASSVDAATLNFAFDCGTGYGSFGSSTSISCDTATDGPNTLHVAAKVQDKDAGVTEYTGSVTVANVAPTIPGTPYQSSGMNPNNSGQFTLAWAPSTDVLTDTINYTLRHKDANDAAYTTVASQLTDASYTFTPGSAEGEGTWTYVVSASDEDAGTSLDSSASGSVVVDLSNPNAPTLSADRAPDYAGGGGWYADTVTVTSVDNGDPALADGSPGSGVNPTTVGPGDTFATSGSHTATDTVLDNAGNQSSQGSVVVQVDATVPTVNFTSCPTYVMVGGVASAGWAASDNESGLASAATGSVSLDTSAPSVSNPVPRTAHVTVYDNVGHSSTADCTYGTVQAIFYAPIDGPSVLNVAKAGRVIPVKADILVNGVKSTTGPVSILVNKLATCTASTTDDLETYAAAGSSNVGNLFRWDTSGLFWIYNLDTSAQGMSAPNCYRANVSLDGTADANGKYTGGTVVGYFLIRLSK